MTFGIMWIDADIVIPSHKAARIARVSIDICLVLSAGFTDIVPPCEFDAVFGVGAAGSLDPSWTHVLSSPTRFRLFGQGKIGSLHGVF